MTASRELALPRALGVESAPAPVLPVEDALRVLGGEDGFVWAPPGGPAFATSGVAAAVGGTLEETRERGRRLLASLAGAAGPPLRLFGAIAFAPWAMGPPFVGFDAVRFVLPRWTYRVHGDRAWITLVVPGRADAQGLLRRAIVRLARPRSAPPPPRITRVDELPLDAWLGPASAAVGAIARGKLTKVVLARRTVVEADGPFDASVVLGRLSEEAGATRFSIGAGARAFLGATPERLVRKRGRIVETEALAGSAPAEADAARTLGSDKERGEHALVVQAVVDRLTPRCTALDVAPAPVHATLRHGVHLRTPVRGLLRGHCHVLELVEALHPTPAVGGVPAGAALAFIAAHEPARRGLYAGPVGWFDAAGDGEFVVGIRSGLLDGARAHVYAGAGIVAGSMPLGEYAETGWKQRTLLRALGAS